MSAPSSLTRSAATTGTRLGAGSDRANARRREARRRASETRLREQLEASLEANTQACEAWFAAQDASQEEARIWSPATARPEDRDETEWGTTIDCLLACRKEERLLAAAARSRRPLDAFVKANLDGGWREQTLRSVLADHGWCVTRDTWNGELGLGRVEPND